MLNALGMVHHVLLLVLAGASNDAALIHAPIRGINSHWGFQRVRHAAGLRDVHHGTAGRKLELGPVRQVRVSPPVHHWLPYARAYSGMDPQHSARHGRMIVLVNCSRRVAVLALVARKLRARPLSSSQN